MTTNKRVQYAVAALAAIAVAFGAYLAGDNGSSRAATAGAAAPPGTQVAPNEQPPAGGQFAPPSRVQVPPGFGAPVTGTTAERVARAALDEYAGTVERVMQLADGSY